ncbi:MAG: MFS transporter [Planctomycetota bacterium]|nr:MFS transporter [Planctomycetota bacterium]
MPGLRWWIVGLLTMATIVNYLDRACLSVAAPTLKEKLQIDEVYFSYIVTGFQLSYMICQPLVGRFLDWAGLRLGMAAAVVWWSIANMLHAFAGGWFSLAAFRTLLGVGEAGNFPGSIKAVGEWFPPKERTIATGIFNVGAGVGAMIAPPAVAWIILTYDWQLAFVLTGAVGLPFAFLWLLLYRPIEKHKWLREKEREHILKGQAELALQEQPEKGVWRVVLPQRNFWAVAIARFFAEPAWQFFLYWIPLYLATEHKLDLKGIAIFAWVPFVAADAGCIVGGFFSPMFARMGLSVLRARQCAATLSGMIMFFAIFVAWSPGPGWAIFFIAVGAFAHQTMSATLLTLPADLFPKRTVGTAYGLAGTCGYASGLIFTLIIGHVAKYVGYTPLFVTIAFLDLIAAGILWTLLRAPKVAAEPAAVKA